MLRLRLAMTYQVKGKGDKGGANKVRDGFWVVVSLLVIAGLLTGGCTQSAPLQPAPVSGVLPAEHPTDFPKNLRWLTEEEKERIIEIAMSTPRAQECLGEESEYTSRISWVALTPSSTGKGYSGYRIFEYEIVKEGIPRGTVDIIPPGYPEKIVSVGVSEEDEIYPCVHLHFAEPLALTIMAAIDLEKEKSVYVDYYPQRRGPVLPTKTPPSAPPEEAN